MCLAILLSSSFPIDLTSYSNFTLGTLNSNWGVPTINNNTPGQLIIAGAGTTALSGTGSLIELEFMLNSHGMDLISFTNVELNDGQIDAAGATDVSFEVIENASTSRLISIVPFHGSEVTSATIPILIDNADEVIGYFIEITYPNSLANYIGINQGGLTSSWGDPTINDSTAGLLIIAGAGTTPLSGNGTLVELNFKLDSPGTSVISVTTAELNDGQIDAAGEIDVPFEVQPVTNGSWNFSIDVTNADKTSVSFGMNPLATDNFEPGIDLDASPTPPELVGGVYLLQKFLEYTRDIRGIASEAEWLLVLLPNGNEMTLSWSSPDIPNDTHLSFHEVDASGFPIPGLSSSFGNDGDLTIPDTDIRLFKIRYASDIRRSLSFSPGWNLISIPIIPTVNAVDQLFSDPLNTIRTNIKSLRDGLRGVIFSGNVWGWQNGQYEAVSNLNALRGYWVFTPKASTILIDGLPVITDESEGVAVDQEGNVSVLLDQGWNLIGAVNEFLVLYPLEMPLQGTIWRWENSLYYATDVMKLMNGYWINSQEQDFEFDLNP